MPAPLSVRPLRRRNLAEEVTDLLQGLIAEGRYRPGERLPPQRELAVTFGVGLSSVREAISALSGADLLEVRPGSGTFVTRLAGAALLPGTAPDAAADVLRDLVDVRRALEAITVRHFVARAGGEDVADVRAAVAAMRAAADDADVLARRDAEFHLRIARGSRNAPAMRALQALTPLLETELRHNVDVASSTVGDLEFALRSHERLVETLAAGDADAALARLDEVLRRAAFYADAVGAEPADGAADVRGAAAVPRRSGSAPGKP